MIKFWDVTFPALAGDDTRTAYIYVPDSYKEDTSLRFPVLYMFDGHNVFFDSHATYGKSWGMLEYLENTKTQLIVAAVECNHGANNERLMEYSPYNFTDPMYGNFRGTGDRTLDWYITVFKSYIDHNFPTIPDREHTFIGGSSMGGLMSLYALFTYNHIFSGAIAMSPSIWVAPKKLENLIYRTRLDTVTDLYIDCGENEGRAMRDKLRGFHDICDLLMRKGICVTSRIVPQGEHCEACWEKQLPFAIPAMMYRIDHL